jgi:hypothetical protein
MTSTVFELNRLPPELGQAIQTATPSSELVIVDNNVPIAHLIVCPQPAARVPGLHPGSFVIADDFDAPMPDEFWLGEP